jgi:hypothetical protein
MNKLEQLADIRYFIQKALSGKRKVDKKALKQAEILMKAYEIKYVDD